MLRIKYGWYRQKCWVMLPVVVGGGGVVVVGTVVVMAAIGSAITLS